MPLIIILVDAGLELVPEQLKSEKITKKNLDPDYYPSQILDNAIYHPIMKLLTNSEKKGRPDIVHQFFLNALGSPLNKSGYLKLFLHTINGDIFKVNPNLRILRNYERFKGLMAKLLIDRKIETENEELILEFNGTLEKLVNEIDPEKIYLFSSKGVLQKKPLNLFPSDPNQNVLALIGGFQKGNFSSEVLAINDNLTSLFIEPLDSWIVVNRVITYYELALKI